MLRFFEIIFAFTMIVFFVWPFYALYNLSGVLETNDPTSMEQVIDVVAVQNSYKQSVKKQTNRLENAVDNLVNPDSTIGQVLSNSIQALNQGIKTVSNNTVDAVVDTAWVRDSLRPTHADVAGDTYPSVFTHASFYFFESPTRFLVRLGELGQNPVHFYMTLQDWNWRVTAVYRDDL